MGKIDVLVNNTDKKTARLSGLYFCYWSLNDPLCQTQILAYLRRLTKQGHRFALVTFEQPPYRLNRQQAAATRQELAAEGIYWYRLRYHKQFPLLATAYDCIRGVATGLYLALRHRPAVIHSRASIPAAMALAVSGISRIPFLYDADSRLSEEYADNGHWSRESMAFRITSRLEGAARKRADSLVVLSDRLRREFIDELGVTAPVEVIPCCVDLKRFRFDAAARDARRSELGIGEEKLFVYAGKTGPRYLVIEMFEFFKAAREIAGPSRFLILTRDDEARFHEAATRSGVSRKDYIVRSAAHDEVVEWLSASDVALAFIRSAGCERGASPIKIGEYLAAGLPVAITPAIGDYSDLIELERTGVVVARLDSEGFIEAARRLSSLWGEREGLRERCAAAAQAVSLEAIGIPRYLSVYRGLLTRGTTELQCEMGVITAEDPECYRERISKYAARYRSRY